MPSRARPCDMAGSRLVLLCNWRHQYHEMRVAEAQNLVLPPLPVLRKLRVNIERTPGIQSSCVHHLQHLAAAKRSYLQILCSQGVIWAPAHERCIFEAEQTFTCWVRRRKQDELSAAEQQLMAKVGRPTAASRMMVQSCSPEPN